MSKRGAALRTCLKENEMNQNRIQNNPPVSSELHPMIYGAVVGLALLFVAAAWSFAGGGYVDYLLAIISGFFFVAVAIPYILSRVWRKYKSSEQDQADERISLREWMSSNFQTWQHRLKGSEAAILVLLPFAVVALGMVAFSIVLHVVEHSAHV
jgi:hypothetical protein